MPGVGLEPTTYRLQVTTGVDAGLRSGALECGKSLSYQRLNPAFLLPGARRSALVFARLLTRCLHGGRRSGGYRNECQADKEGSGRSRRG